MTDSSYKENLSLSSNMEIRTGQRNFCGRLCWGRTCGGDIPLLELPILEMREAEKYQPKNLEGKK